ncbi:MAG: hypothetical protein SGI89_14300 [bacterium]|nr:hypothetical protein [bacterium]
MRSFEIIGYTKDFRTNTNILYAQININEYLDLVGKDFDRFEIQRKREKHKGYNRLKRDIEKGTLIPTITLAVEPSSVKQFETLLEQKESTKIVDILVSLTDKIYILDGLQRTYIINDIKSKMTLNNNQKLLLEIWFEEDIKHLIYRLIVLNSGQKPMSMRHQIELLFITMRETLIKRVDGLILLEEKNEDRRAKAKEFPFERLVTSYKSYLTKSPEVDKDNIVAERMIESDMLDSDEEFLSESFFKFTNTLQKYCLLDEQLFRICDHSDQAKYRNWFADANVIQSFFAAVKSFSSNDRREIIVSESIDRLLEELRTKSNGEDVLNLKDLYEILSNEAISKKYNVGFATRKLLTSAFVEYFRYEGEQPIKECWIISSSDL